MVKKIVISLICALIFPVTIAVANSIPTDNMVRTISNSNSYYSNDFESSRFTQQDDLSINTIKGVDLRLKNNVTEEDETLLNYDKKVITCGNSTLYFNSYLNIFKVKNNLSGYVWATGRDVIYKSDASIATARSLASTIIMEYMIYNPENDSYSTNVKSIELNSVLAGDTYKISPNKDVKVISSDIEI